MTTTSSTEDTIEFGKKFAQQLHGGDIILLEGELGSGKTTFVKGICEYFGISKEEVRSPTFTIINTYSTTENQHRAEQLVHIDTYRLKDTEELKEIGIEEMLSDPNSIVFIEWPAKVEELTEYKETKTIKFEHKEENERMIKL
ncbi:MAG: tRNA (adenosine(37)-N6)-threonylcarbamoyltransferase complex ATPase subunit type 1 TsaE [Parcubacteria group bacterium QH_9_35_7]|nr:MAG: tRNA (adenosine(37)-N6)-threonylcarbamoyltransferase complex ATPase subunit type 1 TsaE [Parcubacteria group bacterium QH_9_35_7]